MGKTRSNNQKTSVPKKKQSVRAIIRNNWQLYVLVLPAIIYFIFFHYMPLYGIQIAFKDYKAVEGFDDGVAANSVLWMPDSSASLYRYLELARPNAYVTVTNENIPATMRWLDAMMETEMQFSLYYGEEGTGDQGTGWEYDENGMINSTNCD